MTLDTIEDIVKWRMGSAYDAPIIDWRDRRLNFDAPGMLDSDYAGGIMVDGSGAEISAPPGRGEYNPARHRRLLDAAQDIQKAAAGQGTAVTVFLAMQDARLFPSLEYIGPPTSERCMQLSYARVISTDWRKDTEVGLWPLSETFRWWKLPTSTPQPWSQRQSVLLWRGQPTGFSYSLGEEARPILVGIRRNRRWLDGWLTEEASKGQEHYDAWAGSYQRLIAVRKCMQIAGTDVRFVPMWDGDRRSASTAARYLGPEAIAERMDNNTYFAERERSKYVLCLPGNDVPSSLRQDLLAGCAVLMPRPFWESAWFFGLKPHEHYLPLRADLADLEDGVQWCRDHDAECAEMAERARDFALENFEPSREHKVQARMLARIAQLTSARSLS